jgi:host factor-I protein
MFRACTTAQAPETRNFSNKTDPRGTTFMAERSHNLQDIFLNSVRKNRVPLTIFLVNGVKLTGVVTSFDSFCVLLRRDGQVQLVYKHAISTIMPSQPVSLFETEEAEAG